MKRCKVNGKLYEVRVLRREDVVPGTIVRGQENRGVYRIVCEDEDDLILRNMRHPTVLDVADIDSLIASCWRLVPVA